jgi:hypothetical protein
MWPHEDVDSLNAFYGNPRGGETANPRWEAANIVLWEPPYPMFYSDGHRTPLPHIRVHMKVLKTFNEAFSDVLQTMGHDKIKALRLDITGGAFCYRVERGGSRLSVHSWACAIDMDPGHNPFPAHWKTGMIDQTFAGILQKHGFTWRGVEGDIDPMHFQLARRS